MKFYDKYFENNFEELITYYPRFYRDVFEMVEILKAHGGIADEMEANIEQTYLNCFIDYADEDTIEQLEKFLNIGLNKSRTLEERRRLVKSYFVGFGKVSASMIAEMIQSYTGAQVDIRFEPFDEAGNNMLYINFQRGNEPTLYMGDINLLLSKKIPAHIQYQAAVTYHFPVGVGIRRRHYRYGYDLCGTKPDIAMLGALFKRATVTEARQSSYGSEYAQASEYDTLTGVKPEIATIASLQAAGIAIEERAKNCAQEYRKAADGQQEAGRWPQGAKIGTLNEINAVSGVRSSDYGVDYIYCGTRCSQS
ncbi:MAG: putative phage tail protein [Acutalibacteraceae bacterium]|nr:putative phage tail protein [Acutalibacteraceae bacterium]